MYLAIFFAVLGWVLTYAAFSMRGRLTAFVVMVLAFGMAIYALPYINAQNPVHIPSMTISSASGNTVIPAINETHTSTQEVQSFNLVLGYANDLIEFSLVLLILGYWFFANQKEKREKASK